MSKEIPVLRPSVSRREIEAVTKVLESGWWGQGPVTEAFEREFAARAGTEHAVAVNSCTAALHLALRAVKGERTHGNIVVPSLTFLSTAAVGLYEGLEVRFADVDARNLTMDREDALTKIDKDTIAVIPVHFGGAYADVDYPVPVIEDCAHLGGGKPVNPDNLACWSFHPVKNIATGDGGMVTTNSAEMAQKLTAARWMGINKSTWARNGKRGYSWEYEVEELGFKYHANDINSAIGLEQLRRIDELNGRRQKLAARYQRELADLSGVRLPYWDNKTWHLYIVRIPPMLRDHFVSMMKGHGISVGVHYKPVHHYPLFAESKACLPVTDRVWPSLVTLPLFPDMTDREQSLVIGRMRDYFKTDAFFRSQE